MGTDIELKLWPSWNDEYLAMVTSEGFLLIAWRLECRVPIRAVISLTELVCTGWSVNMPDVCSWKEDGWKSSKCPTWMVGTYVFTVNERVVLYSSFQCLHSLDQGPKGVWQKRCDLY